MLKRTLPCRIALALLLLALPATSQADSDSDAELTALKDKVARLEARLAQVEALQPTFTTFMPAFSERFHVLHLAGDKGDWQVASHELAEMQRLMSISDAVDGEKGKLFSSFLGGNLHALEEAIEHGNRDKFDAALKQTVQNCNACHKAVGSPFIQVSLDVPAGLSMRHPHVFNASQVEEMQHTH